MTPENKIKSQTDYTKHLDLILAMIIGDGCLSDSGRLVIAHGHPQKDYCEWKAALLSKIFEQEVKALPTRQCYQVQLQRKFLKNLKMRLYRDRIKQLPQILSEVRDPLEFIAIWIMDDGNVCPSIGKKGICYSEAIQIFTFTDLDDSLYICDWFERKIGIRPKTRYLDRSKQNKKSAYIIKFSAEDTRKLFGKIQDYIPNIPSMNFKFRFLFARKEYNPSTSPRQKVVTAF